MSLSQPDKGQGWSGSNGTARTRDTARNFNQERSPIFHGLIKGIHTIGPGESGTGEFRNLHLRALIRASWDRGLPTQLVVYTFLYILSNVYISPLRIRVPSLPRKSLESYLKNDFSRIFNVSYGRLSSFWSWSSNWEIYSPEYNLCARNTGSTHVLRIRQNQSWQGSGRACKHGGRGLPPKTASRSLPVLQHSSFFPPPYLPISMYNSDISLI
jgi:hypothetical protein